MVLEYYGLSEAGSVREENQDAIRLPDSPTQSLPVALFGLADGMGGYSHGGLASTVALDALFSFFYKQHNPARISRTLQRGIEAANLAVITEARRLAVQNMGTTLTAISLSAQPGFSEDHSLNIAHIGDSRAYLVRHGKATCLTNDHTVVGDLLRMRVLTQDQVRTHARRSVLTRAVGLSLFVQPDINTIKVQAGDTIILLSDGVWSAIQDNDLAKLASQEKKMESICKKTIDTAMDNESDDNLSVIAIHIHSLELTRQNGNSNQKWFQNFFGKKSKEPGKP